MTSLLDDEGDELAALNLIPPPPSFAHAPDWAIDLYREYRALRHRTNGTRMAVDAIAKKLGDEPDADGKGGKGLIGDLRKTTRNVDQLLDLKKMGVGAIGAITIFGALIILGVTHFIQSVSGGAPK